ncbi:hypothetical protein [Patulibacter defluvii]|uniref:hypothetical protein n=1 Tax=Patulibacter defluvii TaxID=3095358 RepID=UPI002A7595AA|nr:hypothetical protein [Patulibacter sp. DM4]
MLSLAVLLAVVSAILAIDARWAHRLDVAVASGIVATLAACAALVGTLPVALGIVAAWLLASLGIGAVVLVAGLARRPGGGSGLAWWSGFEQSRDVRQVLLDRKQERIVTPR